MRTLNMFVAAVVAMQVMLSGAVTSSVMRVIDGEDPHAIKDHTAPFVRLDAAAKSQCEPGQQITSWEECKEAASALGLTSTAEYSAGDYHWVPPGCSYWPAQAKSGLSGTELIFNKAGSNNGNQDSLCRFEVKEPWFCVANINQNSVNGPFADVESARQELNQQGGISYYNKKMICEMDYAGASDNPSTVGGQNQEDQSRFHAYWHDWHDIRYMNIMCDTTSGCSQVGYEKTQCMAKQLCYDRLPAEKVSDKTWECNCLWGSMPNDPICGPWNACITEKQSAHTQTLKEVLKAIKELSGSSSLLSQEDGGNNDDADCYSPVSMDLGAIDCECGAALRASCESQSDPVHCWKGVLCTSPKICQSWKTKVGCNGVLLSGDPMRDVHTHLLNQRKNVSVTGESDQGSLEETLTDKRAC